MFLGRCLRAGTAIAGQWELSKAGVDRMTTASSLRTQALHDHQQGELQCYRRRLCFLNHPQSLSTQATPTYLPTRERRQAAEELFHLRRRWISVSSPFSEHDGQHRSSGSTGLDQVFPAIWAQLEADYGRENLVFPKEIIWLMGAPGSGKGTHSDFLKEARGYTVPTIISSDLLKSVDAERVKASGQLLDDAKVIGLVLRQLLRPEYQNGVIVDGFPRTPVQVEGIKLLRDKMYSLCQEFFAKPEYGDKHRRPRFRVVVLFVSEEESVRRQLSRGEKSIKHNEKVISTGTGDLVAQRPTDFNPDKARERYRIFQQHFETLESLRQFFIFTLIDAEGSIESVRQAILRELEYQSSQELAQATFDTIINIPVIREVQRHARQLLIQRLDTYVARQPVLFNSIIQFLEREIIPSVRLHSFAGRVLFRTSNPLLHNREAIAMVTDVLTERGYRVFSSFKDEHIPESIDRETFQIITRIQRTYDIHIEFPPIRLRGGRDPDK